MSATINEELLCKYGCYSGVTDDNGRQRAKPFEHALEDLVALYVEAGWPRDKVIEGLQWRANEQKRYLRKE